MTWMSKTRTAELGMSSPVAGTRKTSGSRSETSLNARVKLTDSRFTVRQVRRDGDPPLLPHAQTLQGLIHPLDHVSQADVGVIGAVPLITDKNRS